MDILLNYRYPGNIRELENILEHAVIVCQDDIIEPKDLPEYLQSRLPLYQSDTAFHIDSEQNINPMEKEKILQTLEEQNWRRAKTARILGIDRTTLWRKMKKFDLIP